MTKRRKLQNQTRTQTHALLPGLPDHVAQLCLCRLKPSVLYSVSRSWRRLLYSPSFPPFLSLYALLSQSDSDFDSPRFFTFDPISARWNILPPPPPPPDPPFRLLLRHPAFISRNLPIQSVSVAGNLVLLTATTSNLSPALPRPLVFDPVAAGWASGTPLLHPRRWCAAGAAGGSVYVASGIGSQYSAEVARSVEKWDLERANESGSGPGWERMSGLKDGRFSRDAIEAVGWRGKLCMVNVKGHAAKEGAVYDVARDAWEEMPAAMIAGWRGPVAAMDESDLYVVDEDKGTLNRFDPEREEWETVTESERLRGAEQMAAAGGRVCVVCGGGGIVVVDVAAAPPRVWAVEPPPGLQAVAVHVLPRMSETR